MYRQISAIEPLFPPFTPELINSCLMLAEASAALGQHLHPITRGSIADLLRQMNTYYSNLIEGHRTSPVDIERALHRDFSKVPEQRNLQQEALAHLEVQQLVEDRVRTDPDVLICSQDFIRWIHCEFYDRMPAEFRFAMFPDGRRVEVVPGELRQADVQVGQHVAPAHDAIAAFLDRFAERYEPSRLQRVEQLIAFAASHHRLAWIHPFADGNGRVVRLFTHAYGLKTGLGSTGLWSVSRGLARRRTRYYSALAAGDRPREGDYDGRGNLSERGLLEFIRFFFETAHDQIMFMSRLLELDVLEARIKAYAVQRETASELPEGAHLLLLEAFRRGEFARGEAARLLGKSASAARAILSAVVADGLLVSSTERGPVRLGLPVRAATWFFPALFIDTDSSALVH